MFPIISCDKEKHRAPVDRPAYDGITLGASVRVAAHGWTQDGRADASGGMKGVLDAKVTILLFNIAMENHHF
jgi:hypothetical protein